MLPNDADQFDYILLLATLANGYLKFINENLKLFYLLLSGMVWLLNTTNNILKILKFLKMFKHIFKQKS